MSERKDEADYHQCAKEVAEEHHDPVLPDCRPLDAFACGGHHDHGIAREEFGARNHYQNKAKAEQESAEYALNSEGQCWVTNHEREEHRAHGDECACHDREGKASSEGHLGLGHAKVFGFLGWSERG